MPWFSSKRKSISATNVLLRPRRSREFRGRAKAVSQAELSGISLWTRAYGGAWVVFGGALVYGAFFSSLLHITRVSSSGVSSIAPQDIEAEAGIFLSGYSAGIFPNITMPIAFLRRHGLEHRLAAAFPIFRSVSASVRFPNELALIFEERTRRFVLCSGGPCFWVDERGIPFEKAPSEQDVAEPGGTIFLIDVAAKPIDIGVSAFSDDFLREFPPLRERLLDTFGLSTHVRVETPSRLSNEVRFLTSEGWILRMSTEVPSEKSFRALRLLFEKTLPDEDRKRLEYIDLRTENRIFYLLKGDLEKEGERTAEEKREEKKSDKKKKRSENKN